MLWCIIDRCACALKLIEGVAACGCRILHTLRVRYTLDMIYTYSGNILIAVCMLLNIGMLAPVMLRPAHECSSAFIFL